MKNLVEGLKQFERSTVGQKPHALLITCSDSRVLPEMLMQADPGDLFVSRNAGNLVPPSDAPSGEAATIEYAVTALGVTDIIICGHYRCGAVKRSNNAGAGGFRDIHSPTQIGGGAGESARRDDPAY
jgi:carbonic anhydrase